MLRILLAGAAILCFLADADAFAQAKTLVYCARESPDTFNPQLSTSQATFDASSRQIFDRLVTLQPETGEIEPALAESWEISDDGRRYSFRLRANAPFHTTRTFTPSRPLNADDVVFSFERQRDPRHPFHRVSGGGYRYFRGMGLDAAIASVRRENDHTVVFELFEPNAGFLALLAMDFASILSAEYGDRLLAEGAPERLDTEPVGTGPFQLVQYQRDALIRYVAHPGYWAGKAALDNLVFVITPDPSVRFQKLRDGECHVIDEVDPADLPAIMADPEIRVVRRIEPDVAYLAFNTTWPALGDRRVRQALSLAIDRQAIIDDAYHGMAIAATSLVPPTIMPTEAEAAGPDIERARALLAEVGLDSLSIAIWSLPVRRSYMMRGRRVAELIRADWKKVGVDATIVTADWEGFLKRSMMGEHQAILFGWIGETADPDIFLSPVLGCDAARRGANRARWCNTEFDSLLRRARSELRPAARENLFRAALRIASHEAPLLPLVHSVSYVPLRASVTGYRVSIVGGHYFHGVDLR